MAGNRLEYARRGSSGSRAEMCSLLWNARYCWIAASVMSMSPVTTDGSVNTASGATFAGSRAEFR